MTNTVVQPLSTPATDVTTRPLVLALPQLSLHGSDPGTGMPTTWHVTSLHDDRAPVTYLLERADGDIHSPAVWMQARRDASIVGEDTVLDLVRDVMFPPEPDQL